MCVFVMCFPLKGGGSSKLWLEGFGVIGGFGFRVRGLKVWSAKVPLEVVASFGRLDAGCLGLTEGNNVGVL